MTKKNSIKKGRLSLIVSSLALIYLIVLAGFSWGYLSSKYKVFPHQLIVDMQGTVASVKAQSELQENPRSGHELKNPRTTGGVTLNTLSETQDDLIFATIFRDSQFLAVLLNRQGDTVFEWRIPHKEIDMSEAQDRKVVLFVRNQTIHGAHLSTNGDVLLVNEYHGMVKLNRDSEVLWRTPHANHHAVTVAEDGTIWTLGRRQSKDPKNWIAAATAPYVDDTVMHYTADGELINEFSVIDIIEDNQYEGILYSGPPFKPQLPHRDALHINDIDVLSAEQAAYFPNVSEGDLMLSLRTINTIIIIDPEGQTINWSMTGPFLRQHDPQVTKDGQLLVYDNRTSRAQLGAGARTLQKKPKLGYSRLIAIDPTSRVISWSFQGTKEQPFYSSIQGKLEELPNSNVMAVEPEGGRIFEVDRKNGDIVWEYINLLEPGFVGRITEAIPFQRQDLEFLEEQ